jgi:hypothetical protein
MDRTGSRHSLPVGVMRYSRRIRRQSRAVPPPANSVAAESSASRPRATSTAAVREISELAGAERLTLSTPASTPPVRQLPPRAARATASRHAVNCLGVRLKCPQCHVSGLRTRCT